MLCGENEGIVMPVVGCSDCDHQLGGMVRQRQEAWSIHVRRNTIVDVRHKDGAWVVVGVATDVVGGARREAEHRRKELRCFGWVGGIRRARTHGWALRTGIPFGFNGDLTCNKSISLEIAERREFLNKGSNTHDLSAVGVDR